jgi:hypothetical protein
MGRQNLTPELEGIKRVQSIQYFSDMIFFQTDSNQTRYSPDRGKTIKTFESPESDLVTVPTHLAISGDILSKTLQRYSMT